MTAEQWRQLGNTAFGLLVMFGAVVLFFNRVCDRCRKPMLGLTRRQYRCKRCRGFFGNTL